MGELIIRDTQFHQGTHKISKRHSKKLFKKIRTGDFQFHSPHWDEVSEDAKNYISSLLTVDPSARLSANDALKHKWITSADDVLASRDLTQTVTEMKRFPFL